LIPNFQLGLWFGWPSAEDKLGAFFKRRLVYGR
jgi:hypothetical protein